MLSYFSNSAPIRSCTWTAVVLSYFSNSAYYELYLDCCHAVWVALGQVLQGPVIAVQLSETT